MIYCPSNREVIAYAAPAGFGVKMQGPDTAPAFDPKSIGGMTLWLDPKKGITTSGGFVSAWADQSGLHNDINTWTGGAFTSASNLGGKPSVDGNGTGNGNTSGLTWASLLTGGITAYTIAWCWQYTGTFAGNTTAFLCPTVIGCLENTTTVAFFGGGLDSGDATKSLGCANYFDSGGSGWTNIPTTPSTPNAPTPHVCIATMTGGNLYSLYIDGGSVPVTQVVTTNPDIRSETVLIGAGGENNRQRWVGQIGNVMVFNKAISSGDRGNLFPYLAATI